jgi:hypothetical protein
MVLPILVEDRVKNDVLQLMYVMFSPASAWPQTIVLPILVEDRVKNDVLQLYYTCVPTNVYGVAMILAMLDLVFYSPLRSYTVWRAKFATILVQSIRCACPRTKYYSWQSGVPFVFDMCSSFACFAAGPPCNCPLYPRALCVSL